MGPDEGADLPSVMKYFQVEGHEVHEVAVGPVHAGIIEPGHFRFQCHGEIVPHLEISLGYQHRGIEEAILRGPEVPAPALCRRWRRYEHRSYDGLLSSWWNRWQAAMRLKAQAIRGIALELERLANHTGDLGLLPAISGICRRLSAAGFGDFLNMSALLCGNRFGRGLAVPGGVCFDLTPKTAETLAERLMAAKKTYPQRLICCGIRRLCWPVLKIPALCSPPSAASWGWSAFRPGHAGLQWIAG